MSAISRVAPDLERFLNRHILGIAPHPDHWPAPHDAHQLPVPTGHDVFDSTGAAWVLAHEHMPAWHHRRTSLGAQGYRFAHNGEFDCGWQLANVAARFVRIHITQRFDCVTMLPPPNTHRSQYILPWLAQRLADSLDIPFHASIFTPLAPYAEHPDVARHLTVPAADLFGLPRETDTRLSDAAVLLVDWKYNTGRTLRALAQQLIRKGAAVVRFAWFD